ncbi:MAG: Rrf2 family transcriptional regulator [Candidatus Aminicenantes bacterium]|nr:Rrf2 family transcriptional regulator [Candidatus Aminicenantes bacterium]
MDIIRRNTDYSLRFAVNLAQKYGKNPVSARILSEEEKVPYQLTCKLLQKLHHAGFVESRMGPKGGYFLAMAPSEITLTSLVQTIQGPVSINQCLFEQHICPRQPNCPISRKLSELQEHMDSFLSRTTLEDVCSTAKDTKTK